MAGYMTTNTPNYRVVIKIGPNGTGRTLVDQPPAAIEMVRVLEPFGTPHVLDTGFDPQKSWVQVLGAEPETDVTVVYYA